MPFKIDFKQAFGKATDTLFSMALTDTTTFHGAVRPVLLGHAEGDIVKAQELVLSELADYMHVIRRRSDSFLKQYNSKISFDGVRVPVAGKLTTPVGTACGVDLNADGLEMLAYLFGFQVPGPVSVRPHHLESAPFQDDPRRGDLYIPPSFASKGVDQFAEKLRQYREAGGTAIVLPALVGIPTSRGGTDRAADEMRTLLETLAPYADGFVWCPALANGGSVLSPDELHRTAGLMANIADTHLNLVEMPAYEPEGRDGWLAQAEAFLTGGGDGLVAVGGLSVPKSRLPKPDRWPFETAILCGRSMGAYRQRAIEDARAAFPKAFLAASGGFHDRDDAFKACRFANVIMENEAFTRYGPAMSRRLLHKLAVRMDVLKRQGAIPESSLHMFQQQAWNGG